MGLEPDVTALSWPTPHPPELLGKASRRAATAALEAHVAVVKGEPLRRALGNALAADEKLGGQERRFVALAVRELSRHMRLLDLALRLVGHPPSKLVMVQDQVLLRYAAWRRLFGGVDWARLRNEIGLPGPIRPRTVLDAALREVADAPLPPLPQDGSRLAALATRHSLPRWLSERLAEEAPEEEWGPLFEALNREAPIQLRVRDGREPSEVREALAAEEVQTRPVDGVPRALVVEGSGHRVFDTAPMKQHALQVQDVGSQLIVALCGSAEELRGRTVADVCAGAGGKTLALADLVGRQGRVLAADASKRRLQDARERARRLRLDQVSFPFPLRLEQVDVALIDAPCSGIGSLSREPDARWSLSPDRIEELAEIQDELLRETAGKLRPGAVMVYATCSLLREENEARVEAFLAESPEWRLESADGRVPEVHVREGFLRVMPHRAGGGGFFAARLVRQGA